MRAVITGATKGIGAAIAKLFAEKGVDLAICSRSDQDLEKTKNKLKEINPKIEIIYKAANLRSKSETQSFGLFVVQKWGNIDILVNNAGLFIPGQIHDEPDGNLENMIETNLYSAYHLSRIFVPGMIGKNSGHIINMCSIASLFSYPNAGAYTISKFAMLGMSKVLRDELKDKGIRVTSILPGGTWSNSWAGSDLPRERIMEPEDIAKVTWNAIELGKSAVVEEIIIRPQKGDL